MKYFILGSIITLLISLSVFLYIQNTSLSAISVTYKTDKEFIDKDFQKSKEAYFIQQQSDNVSLILFTVTILFTIFATFTFIRVKSEFHSAIKKNDKRYDSYKAEYDESVIHINNLRSAFNLQYADKINEKFGEALLKRPLDIPNLIELGLMSCQNYYYAVGYNSNNSEQFSKVVTKHITPILNCMVEKIKTVDSVELNNISYVNFLIVKESFDLVSDKDNLQKFSFIFSKLSFKNLD